MTAFCVFKELKVRDYSLPDPPFAIRGLIVFLNPEGVSVNALFPPYQLEAPEHKADFSRLLSFMIVPPDIKTAVIVCPMEVGCQESA